MVYGLLANMIITDVVAAYTMYSAENSHVTVTDRPKWGLLIKYEGKTAYRLNEKTFIADANHIMLLPKGTSYELKCTQAGHFALIEFESDATYHEPIRISVKDGKAILNQFRELEYRRDLRENMCRIESIKNVYLILLSLAKAISDKYQPSKKQKVLQPAIEYISQNFNQPIKNETLAALVGLSPSYFRKVFSEVMGESPIAYARSLRIEKGKEILKSDHESLSDIALALGYSNLFDFSRDFKKHTGVAPSKYASK